MSVDDIRGFQNAFVNGVQQPVGSSNPLTVTVGANAYTLVAAVADTTNVSTAPNGVSGVLTFSGNVVGERWHVPATPSWRPTRPVIVRPSQRTSELGVGCR